jgi:hypothetical protein
LKARRASAFLAEDESLGSRRRGFFFFDFLIAKKLLELLGSPQNDRTPSL